MARAGSAFFNGLLNGRGGSALPCTYGDLDGSKNPALGWEAAVIETGMAVR